MTASRWRTKGLSKMLNTTVFRAVAVRTSDGIGTSTVPATTETEMTVGLPRFKADPVMAFLESDTVLVGDYIRVPVTP